MPANSDVKLLHDLGKILSSTGFKPSPFPAADPTDALPLSTRHSSCIAVDECVEAYNLAFRKEFEKKDNEYAARRAAAVAYRQAMPALSGSQNIADFIACVAHGLVLDAIPGNDASRLIYAAQVAHTANPVSATSVTPSRRRGRPRHSEELNEDSAFATTASPATDSPIQLEP